MLHGACALRTCELVEEAVDLCDELDRQAICVELLVIEHGSRIGRAPSGLLDSEHEHEYEYEHDESRPDFAEMRLSERHWR
jgi:hypothetical protein